MNNIIVIGTLSWLQVICQYYRGGYSNIYTTILPLMLGICKVSVTIQPNFCITSLYLRRIFHFIKISYIVPGSIQ